MVDHSGKKVGHALKEGPLFKLFDVRGLLIKSVRGHTQLLESKDAVVSDVIEADEGLTLLCKVCGERVAVEVVEKHARVCAISYPVQVLRFAHSVEAEQAPAPKKKSGDEIAVLDDLPQTVLTALDKTGLPREMFAKHLDVLINVLNFASKMKFTLAENRPSPVKDAASKALKSRLDPNDVKELCRVFCERKFDFRFFKKKKKRLLMAMETRVLIWLLLVRLLLCWKMEWRFSEENL